jgi:CRP/FNR family transcriptional regulator, cyclic AMP receptor protein
MDKARLKAIPLFANLDDHDLQVIATFANETSVSEGDVLVREGDFSYELMAIEEGTAEVRRGGDVLATLGPGDFFGEVGVLQNEMRNATIIATSAMRLITLTTWELKRMRNMPGVMDKLNETIASRAPQ